MSMVVTVTDGVMGPRSWVSRVLARARMVSATGRRASPLLTGGCSTARREGQSGDGGRYDELGRNHLCLRRLTSQLAMRSLMGSNPATATIGMVRTAFASRSARNGSLLQRGPPTAPPLDDLTAGGSARASLSSTDGR
jgi:hypothetical protein